MKDVDKHYLHKHIMNEDIIIAAFLLRYGVCAVSSKMGLIVLLPDL